MGKCKSSAARALDWLVAEGVEVAAVVASEPDRFTREEQRVDLVAERHGLRLVSDDELYAEPPDDVDVVISFLFWKLIREPLVSLGRIGCLNFHPAPLPDMRGMGGFNVAILEGFAEWGVSGHFVDADFDTGDLVRVDRFPIAPGATALSLDVESQVRLLALFKDVVDLAADGAELPRTPQGEGRYVTKDEFEAMRRVPAGENAETLERRIRAFWYPPYDGATIEIAGRTVSLVDRALLREIAAANREAGRFP